MRSQHSPIFHNTIDSYHTPSKYRNTAVSKSLFMSNSALDRPTNHSLHHNRTMNNYSTGSKYTSTKRKKIFTHGYSTKRPEKNFLSVNQVMQDDFCGCEIEPGICEYILKNYMKNVSKREIKQ